MEPGVHPVSFLFGPHPFGGEQLQQVYSPPLPLLYSLWSLDHFCHRVLLTHYFAYSLEAAGFHMDYFVSNNPTAATTCNTYNSVAITMVLGPSGLTK